MGFFESSARFSIWDYLGMLRRRWVIFLACLLVLPAIAFFWQTRTAENFQAEASVLVTASAAQEALDSGSTNSAARTRALTNEINLALSQEVRLRVEAVVGEVDDDDILISAVPGADVLTFSANQPTAEGAALLANEWADAYVEAKRFEASASIDEAVAALQLRLATLGERHTETREPLTNAEQRLAEATTPEEVDVAERDLARVEGSVNLQLSVLDAQIDAVAASIADLQLSGELSSTTGSIRVIETAAVPLSPTNVPLVVALVLAIVLGAALGLALVILIERIDRRVRNVDDLERLGFSHIGSIPRAERRGFDPALSMVLAPHGNVASGYQAVRNTLRFILASKGIRSVVVTSANEGEGKTSTAVNLAWSLAQGGNDVTLVDADLRRPRVHEVFDMDRDPGLADIVNEELSATDARAEFAAVHDFPLGVVPAGQSVPRPADLFVSESFRQTWADTTGISDITVVDSAPVLPVADTLAFLQHADAVILVARAKVTRRSELVRAAESITKVGGQLIGVVLVGDEESSSGYGKYGELETKALPVGVHRLEPSIAELTLFEEEDDVDVRESTTNGSYGERRRRFSQPGRQHNDEPESWKEPVIETAQVRSTK